MDALYQHTVLLVQQDLSRWNERLGVRRDKQLDILPRPTTHALSLDVPQGRTAPAKRSQLAGDISHSALAQGTTLASVEYEVDGDANIKQAVSIGSPQRTSPHCNTAYRLQIFTLGHLRLRFPESADSATGVGGTPLMSYIGPLMLGLVAFGHLQERRAKSKNPIKTCS